MAKAAEATKERRAIQATIDDLLFVEMMDTARKLAHEEIPNFDDRCREQLDLSSKEKRWQQLEKFELIKDYALRPAYTPPYRLFEVLAYDYEKSEKAGWYDCAIILCLPNYWGYSMGKVCKGILLTMLRFCDWFDVVIDDNCELRLVLNLHITSNKDQGSFICRDMDIDNIKIDDPDVIFSLDRDITCEVLMDARKPKFSQELIESAPKVIKEKLLEKQKGMLKVRASLANQWYRGYNGDSISKEVSHEL